VVVVLVVVVVIVIVIVIHIMKNRRKIRGITGIRNKTKEDVAVQDDKIVSCQIILRRVDSSKE